MSFEEITLAEIPPFCEIKAEVVDTYSTIITMSTNTITTSALPPGSTVYVLASPQSSFQASSFANDLFNSLAPLLTLFGEQPTRQYLSMSLSLADHILLGIAPIGILTIVVSAIRISGSPLLKALVGRSRENRASIEAEVLSSTSTRVRELWDGERIVKEAGESRTTEVIYNQKQQLKTGKMLVQTFPNAVSGPRFSLMYRLQTKASGVEKLKMAFGWNGKAPDGHNNITSAADEPFLKERLQTEAPNISLNVSGVIALRAEIWVFGIIGYVLQLGVLAVAGLSVYRFDWRGPKEASIPAYAFPCFATGTVLITIFTTICGYIIEATTTKETYGPALTSGKDAPNPYMVFRVCTPKHDGSLYFFDFVPVMHSRDAELGLTISVRYNAKVLLVDKTFRPMLSLMILLSLEFGRQDQINDSLKL